MFGSTVLEVVIGLVFLYLALSLVCSALNEYYSALLSRRAKHLRDSLYAIFNKDDPKGLAFLLEFYTHPLISGLSPSRKPVAPPTGPDLVPRLNGLQMLVVVPARIASDLKRRLAGWYDRANGVLRWVGDAIRDPHGVGGVMEGLRKELAVAARWTPVYIPDRAFSGAIFAVLASDSGAVRRIQVELNDQLAGINKLFQALADPAASAELTALLGKVGQKLVEVAEETKDPVKLNREVKDQFETLLAKTPEVDESYQPALDLLAGPIGAIAPGAVATDATAARARIDQMRKSIADAAGTLVDGAAKRELIRLAARTDWFSSVRKPPEAGALLASLKADLEARDKARKEARARVVAASVAILATGPRIPLPQEVRDHVWDALQASMQRLGAAFATLDQGPLRERLIEQAKEVSEKIGPAKLDSTMSVEQAQEFAKTRAFDAIRGTLIALGSEVGVSKAAGWVEREAALISSSEADLITIAKLRDAVAALPESDLRAALLSLMDEVGDDLDKVKQNIQVWYNDSMERVSGWYKRNTQLILSMIAIAIAVTLNADTIAIAEKLWKDSTLRANVNALAKTFDDQAQAKAQAPKPAGANAPAAQPVAGAEQVGEDYQVAKEHLLKQTGLPLGWTKEDLTAVGFDRDSLNALTVGVLPTWNRTKLEGLLAKLLGLTLTAIAVSMGAPFWFDILGKLVNVRTAGLQPQKTPEKSPVAPPTTEPTPSR